MTYTKEYATLTTKAEVIEHIINIMDGKKEQIERYEAQISAGEETDYRWEKTQIYNLSKELTAYDEIMKLIAK